MRGVIVGVGASGDTDWIRTLSRSIETTGPWVMANTELVVMIAGAVLAAMLLLRLLIRGGMR